MSEPVRLRVKLLVDAIVPEVEPAIEPEVESEVEEPELDDEEVDGRSSSTTMTWSRPRSTPTRKGRAPTASRAARSSSRSRPATWSGPPPNGDGALQVVDVVEPCDGVLTIFAPDPLASPDSMRP